jgi:hypothetical protein
MTKFIFFITVLWLTTKVEGQTIHWDCSAIESQIPIASTKKIFLGFYNVAISYTNPYTLKEEYSYKSFEKLNDAFIQFHLEIPTEVDVVFLGLNNPINVKLWIQPNEQIFIHLKTIDVNVNRIVEFTNYKNSIEFKGVNSNYHQAFSFLHKQIQIFEDSQSLFQAKTYSNWGMNSNLDSLIFRYTTVTKNDLVWLESFVKTHGMSTEFLKQFKQYVVVAWAKKAKGSLNVNLKEDSIIDWSTFACKDYALNTINVPFSVGMKEFVKEVVSQTYSNEISYHLPIETIISILSRLEFKDGWENLYEDMITMQEAGTYAQEQFFGKLQENNKEEFEFFIPVYKAACKKASSFHELLTYIRCIDSTQITIDLKLQSIIQKIDSENLNDKYLEQCILDSLFQVIGNFSSGSETNEVIKKAFLKESVEFEQLDNYQNRSIFLDDIKSDRELDSLIKIQKTKLVVVIMLGHNIKREERVDIFCSSAKYIREKLQGEVEFIFLIVDNGRKSWSEEALCFAQKLQHYGLSNGYVVNAKSNSFYQDVYSDRKPCVVRIYKTNGVEIPLGKITKNVPETPIMQLIRGHY